MIKTIVILSMMLYALEVSIDTKEDNSSGDPGSNTPVNVCDWKGQCIRPPD